MKKQRDENAEAMVTLRLWKLKEAHKLVPYLRSLTQSLREAWIDLRQAQEQLKRLDSRTGRADRDTLIQRAEALRDAERAETRLEETMHEMLPLSAYCVDPATGVVVIPFLRGEALAWFVFDMFDPQGLVAWRLYSDPLEARRPLSELEGPASTTAALSA